MKKFLIVIIIVIAVALVGVGGYFGYLQLVKNSALKVLMRDLLILKREILVNLRNIHQ